MTSRPPFDAVISGIGSMVPEKVVTNFDLEKMVDTTDEWIVTRTGIRERRILGDDFATSDMGIEAGRKALEMAGVSKDDVGLVICATYTPDYIFPASSCLVQAGLGLKKAAAFDLNAACSGFIYGLITASQFVQSGTHEHVLLVGADTSSRIMDWKDRSTCVIFGDGASAVLVSRSNSGRGLKPPFWRTDGSGWKSLYMPAGGTKIPTTVDTVRERLHHLRMDGRETFKFAARAMTEAATAATKLAGLTPADVTYVIPHQANIRIIQAACARMGFSEEKVVVNIDRYGNTVAASIGIAMDETFRAGKIKDGDNLLLIGFGAGLTWGGVVVQWGR